jgi:PBP1b-binding outer membrane lipoprotein LpoB
MKILQKSSIAIALVSILVLFGCASNPLTKQYQEITPTGRTNTVYQPAPWVTNGIAIAGEINRTVPPNIATPFIDLGLGALATVAGLIAAFQTKKANTQHAAADVLAGQVVSAGRSTQALQDAGANQATVARHIDNNTVTEKS